MRRTSIILIGAALAFGLAAKKLTSKLPRGFRITCAALIAADLVLRALPLPVLQLLLRALQSLLRALQSLLREPRS